MSRRKKFNQEFIIQQTLNVYWEILLNNAKCEMGDVK